MINLGKDRLWVSKNLRSVNHVERAVLAYNEVQLTLMLKVVTEAFCVLSGGNRYEQQTSRAVWSLQRSVSTIF